MASLRLFRRRVPSLMLITMSAFVMALPSSAAAAAKVKAEETSRKPTADQPPYIRQSDLPSNNWMSIDVDVEFLPALNMPQTPPLFGNGNNPFAAPAVSPTRQKRRAAANKNKKKRRRRNRHNRKLEDEEAEEEEEQGSGYQSVNDYPQYRVQPFVEGYSDYDEYQQAWRMLGFMIDCDEFNFHYSDDDDNSGNSNDENDSGEGCTRYVLWAAYVDLEYEGYGIGEYQYWDRNNEQWDTTTCEYTGSSRCAKMDCHLDNTHWSLLGFFKHQSYDDWMEQLFKHEGVCIWTDDEYAFMSAAREMWPQGCVNSGTTYNDDGDYIYYDVKPVNGGGITLGLYTDTRCVEEYQPTSKNDPITAENVIGNILSEGEASGDGDDNYQITYDTLDESLEAWDSAFDIFKICQPCLAHDLLNYGYSNGDMQGENYGKYNYGNDDDGNNDAADYDCYDDAGYTNVNQCMKFMAKTEMYTATFRDLSLATSQGTLVNSPLAGYRVQKKRGVKSVMASAFGTYFFFCVSMIFFVYAALKFRKMRREKKVSINLGNPTQPLVFA